MEKNQTILVYSDVHGNIEALEKLYATKDYKNADQHIFLGDAVVMGPHPKECLQKIFASKDIYLLGNHDSYCAYGFPKDMNPSKRKLEHQTFMRSLIPREYKEQLKILTKEYYLKLCGKTIYFTHYLWENDFDVEDELEGSNLCADELDKKFKRIDADVIVTGHDHFPSHHKSKTKEYFICGSIGLKIPAKYLLITVKNGKLKIKHKTLRYNYRKVIKEMYDLNYPGASLYVQFLKNKVGSKAKSDKKFDKIFKKYHSEDEIVR